MTNPQLTDNQTDFIHALIFKHIIIPKLKNKTNIILQNAFHTLADAVTAEIAVEEELFACKIVELCLTGK